MDGESKEGRELKSRDELMREIEVLRDRISRLSAASLRISASLDLNTVLSEVVDSARALTGARYGVITTIGDAGEPEDFVSSGYTADEHRQIVEWADGPRLFEHFRDLEGTLRVSDFPGHVRSLGMSPHPIMPKTVQAAVMRHRGVNVGNFFLSGKAGGREFTSEDEDILLLFAAQAATAIANARTYRDENRARADLEALVDTSPVGVTVFDARTGQPVSFNREARRIIGGLVAPGQSVEQLLEVVKYRRADGREISLKESPLAQLLSSATTVRAEEIVIEVPGGRSVTTLVNAAPVRSEDGVIDSVVVTFQDMAPLEDLERSRAEFLSLVSHELRTPLAAIKGSAATLRDASSDPAPGEMRQFLRIIEQQADHMRRLINDLLDAGSIEAGTLSVTPEPAEVADLVEQARKVFLSRGARHDILTDLPPDLPRVMADPLRIVQVLNNLFSNASRLSPQALPIRVSAVQEGHQVEISVSDEGAGIPPEQLAHLFRKYGRVGGGEDGIRGSGLGLAICKGLVEAHGGRIRAESGGEGLGARFTFTIPAAEETAGRATAGVVSGSSRSPRQARERKRILVVDDDPLTLRFVREALAAAGYEVFATGDSREVSGLIHARKPHLVLLDLMLPGIDGIELMETVPDLADLPVIFISGYGRDETVAKALQQGAADYIVKPFSRTELTARVQAVLRRVAGPPEPFRLGNLAIDYEAYRVTVAGSSVELTATEFDLLRVLSVNAGRVVTYETLLRKVWDRREGGNPQVVRTYVKRLRRKLGDGAENAAYIFTVRQVGYRMARPSEL